VQKQPKNNNLNLTQAFTGLNLNSRPNFKDYRARQFKIKEIVSNKHVNAPQIRIGEENPNLMHLFHPPSFDQSKQKSR